MKARILLAVVALAVVGVLTTGAEARGTPLTTVDRTLGDLDGDNRLEFGPGEPYLVREELGTANPDRETLRERLFTFGQVSDFQTADEESPLRFEDFDDLDLPDFPLGGAYRPEESLLLFGANAMARTLNGVRSPVSGRLPSLAIVTGDNADNMQENETEWYRDVLDGGTINPNSGDPDYDPGWDCFPDNYPTDAYQGVRGYDWYEPDGESDGAGYSPRESENFGEVDRHVALRDFPGLFERAQGQFGATGLDLPWLTVFGNHDNLVNGTFVKTENMEDRATGCRKDLDGDLFGEVVQPDPRRHLLEHGEWIAEHFDSPRTPGPVGHGFKASQPDQGYYSRKLKAGLRLIGLDSVNRDGLHNGIVRDARLGAQPQWEWLDKQLQKANRKDEKVIVIAHHSLNTMNNTDLLGWEDQHCGLIDQQGELGRDCDAIGNESLEELFYRHGNVIAYIAGHEHENHVTPRRRAGGAGSFWEVTTASEVDWPQQSSMFELYDNHDGTISIFRTLVDHDAPPDAGDNPNLGDPDVLASIGRELAFNDYQVGNGEDGTRDRRGARLDRNVELILDLGR